MYNKYNMTKENIKERESLHETIKKSRPNLSPNSIKTYISSLYHLYKKSGSMGEFDTLNFLKDFDEMKKIISELEKETTRKTRLTSIVVGLKSLPENKERKKLIEKYTEMMEKCAEKYMNWVKKQEKSEKQEKNWVTLEELDKVTNRLFTRITEREIRTKDNLTKKDYNLLQEYIILRLYDSFPIRNDFGSMKVISSEDFEKLKDKKDKNYLVTNGKYKIVLNKYKNSKFLGSKEYLVDSKLKKVLKLWFKHNKSGFVLTKQDRERELGSNGLTKFLTKIFQRELGKNISTSMLRHIRATEDLKDEPSILQKEKEDKATEKKYLHSVQMHNQYRKIDKK